MGRPATGAVRWNTAGHWEARVWVNGKRTPVALHEVPACKILPDSPPTGCPCASCALAEQVAKIVADRAKKEGVVPVESGEVANEWFGRYVELHAKLGNRTTQHMGDWRKYVADLIGTKTMVSVKPSDVKAIRDSLTRARLEGKIGAKRALNLWSDLVKAPFSRAWSDDDPRYSSLRVGPAARNPALGIKPPASLAEKEEDERERQALEPGEAIALMACDSIPLDMRRFYTVAMYTGLRPAELYGLVWSDVRLEAQRPVIKVQRSRDMKTAEEKGTKTKQSVRDVPIHPHLRPLLTAMRDEVKDRDARVFHVDDDKVRDVEKMVSLLRAHLTTAGIERDELHHGTQHLLPFDVRSFRTTFATWTAQAGYDSTWLDVWIGHKPKSTSAKHYVKQTPAFEDVTLKSVLPGVTPPFPPIPTSLFRGQNSGLVLDQTAANVAILLCEGRDLKTA
jgi:integrase